MKTKHILLGVVASVTLLPALSSCDDYLNTDKYFVPTQEPSDTIS